MAIHPGKLLRQFGIRELVIALGLTIFALGLVFYKVYVLDYRVVEIDPEPGYKVSLTIDVHAANRDVQISTFLPLQTPRQKVRNEVESSEGLEFIITPDREAMWHAKSLSGEYQIQYSFFAQTEETRYELPSGILSRPKTDPLLAEFLEGTPSIQCEEDDIVAKAWELMPIGTTVKEGMNNVFDFVYKRIGYKQVRGPTDALTAFRLKEASCNGKNRLMIALCRARGIPARFAKGLILENSNKRTTHAWSEVYLGGQWIPFCPTNGYFAMLPEHYLELAKDDRALFRHSRSIGFDWEFVVTPQVQALEEAVQANASNPLNFLNYWVSLKNSDVSIRLIMVILLIPIAASVVSISRSVIGLQTFGTFMPSLIAVSFLQTGFITGSLLFMGIMVVTSLVNLLLFRLRILHLPRLVIILTIVVMAIMAVSVLSVNLGIPGSAGVSLFPIAILSLTSERFSRTVEEHGWGEAGIRTVLTYIVSAACFLVIAQRDLQLLVAAFPELLLINIALNMALGSWHGLRLMEYLRFRHILKAGKS